MSFTMECPFCSQRLDVPDEMNNTTANCPGCGNELYLSKEDAVDDDPRIASMRSQYEAENRRHMNELRAVAMMQEQQRQSEKHTETIVWTLLWIFVWGPLIGGVVFALIWGFAYIVHGQNPGWRF